MQSRLLAVLLATLLVTSGCLGFLEDDRPPSDERAVDAIDRSVDAIGNTDSYRANVNGELEANADGRTVSVDVTGDAVVNASSRRMLVTAGANDETRRTYVTGRDAYAECSRMGWSHRNLSTDHAWIAYTPAGQQLALLDATEVYWRGTETIDGTETAVVFAYPTKQELQAAPSAGPNPMRSLQSANLRNLTVTVWLDTDTWLPVKVHREVFVTSNGNRATGTITFSFTGYDDPVTVTRPDFDPNETWSHGCPSEN